MNHPNFFIIGAPKSGTTSLYNYLSEHPNVFMSKIKGPHYFASRIKTKKEYLDLFKDAKKQHICIGEASVLYLPTLTDYPDSKLIIILRNPVDVIQSLLKKSGDAMRTLRILKLHGKWIRIEVQMTKNIRQMFLTILVLQCTVTKKLYYFLKSKLK